MLLVELQVLWRSIVIKCEILNVKKEHNEELDRTDARRKTVTVFGFG